MSHSRMTARIRSLAFAITAAAATLVLAGCESGSAAKAGDGPPVVAPGKPGEAAETLSAEEARKAVADDSPNAADFRYVRMMIEHHGQAVEMTGPAAEHAGSDKVRRLAERIAASQQPEIDAMQGWLDQNAEDGGKNGGGAGGQDGHAEHAGGTGHDHGTMPGMATEQQLEQLRRARGKAFDELFLTLMITHHQGAVTMATELLSDGNNVLVEEMANDVIAQQTAEIGRMRDL